MGGCGAHEVLVESPKHDLFLAQQPIEQVQLVLRTLQFRYQDLMQDRRFQMVIIFKNHGVEAGTSLAHPHWQLIATPVVPRLLRLKHFEASEFFDRTGQCLYCLIREQELTFGKRVLATNADYVAFMPYASHTPFETWIVPRHHNPYYTQMPAERLWTLAELMKIVLLKLYTGETRPSI
jgi:UDPglucose--hexose-1-phosphate uridylyltransferase